MARRLPFTYGHAARALLLRLLLQPSRWGAQRTALSLTAVASAWCAARTRPAALAVAKLAQTVRQTASRTQTLAWAGTFAVLLLFVRDKRELLSLFLSADARARWRRRRELQHKLASCSLYSEFSALAAELESLLPPPRYAPSHGVRRPQLAAVSEYTVGTSILDSLCAGRALDEDTLVHLWTGLRAGLAAKATDIAVETLSERIAGRGAPAASPRSPQASDVRNTLRRLVFDVPDSTPGFGPRERAAMLEETLTICGRHALLLSGGGMLGAVHVGCVSALMKAGCLPHVIAGSSAGSIVAAVVCTRTTSELESFLQTFPKEGEPATELFTHFFGAFSVRARVSNLWRTGYILPSLDLRTNLRRLLGDVTFRQAYEHSHRILNVSLSSERWGERPRLLNYLSAPHVVVWSAVAASCAFPGLYAPQPLLSIDRHGRFVHHQMSNLPVAELHAVEGGRRWRDGSLEMDLPEQALSELFHVSLTCVSQTNPWLVAALKVMSLFPRPLAAVLGNELQHAANQGRLLTTMAVDALGVQKGHVSRGLQMLFDFLSLVGQSFAGDITFAHRLSFAQVLSAISNPTVADLRLFLVSGQRSTWSQLPLLRRAVEPAQRMEAAIAELRIQAARVDASPNAGPLPPPLGVRPRKLGSSRASTVFERYRGVGSLPTFDKLVFVDSDSDGTDDVPGVLTTPRPRRKCGQIREE